MSLVKRFVEYRVFWVLCVLVLGVDQLTKYLVNLYIPEGAYVYPEPVPVVEGVLYWVHIFNTGAAWGAFKGNSVLLGLLAIVVLGLMYVYREKLELKRGFMQITSGMLVGGIVGNLIDRMVYGHVIDFIDVHLPFYRWPAFNVADMGICVGVVLYIISSFLSDR